MRNSSKMKFVLISAIGGWALFSAAQSYAGSAGASERRAPAPPRVASADLAPEFDREQSVCLDAARVRSQQLMRLALAPM